MRESRKPPQRGRTRGTHARPSERAPLPRSARPASSGTATAPGARFATVRMWRLRPRSVRAKIVALLMVPVIAMMALWGLAAVDAAQNAWTGSQLHQLDSTEGMPLGMVLLGLQQERAAAVELLSTPGSDTIRAAAERAALTRDAAQTDGSVKALRRASTIAAAALDNVGQSLSGQLDALWSSVAGLTVLREQVTGRLIDADAAEDDYTATVDSAISAEQALAAAQQTLLGATPQAIVGLSEALEMIARQNSVLTGAYAAGSLDPSGYQDFVGSLYEERDLVASALPQLPAQYAAAVREISTDPAGTQLVALQNAVMAAGPGTAAMAAVPQPEWAAAVIPQLSDLGARMISMVGSQIDVIAPYGLTVFSKAGAELLLGLIAVILSLLISVRVGRNLVLELVGLRDSALDLAERRLPRSMARLRSGERLDLAAEAAPAPQVDDEVGQVAEALVAVHRSALEAAIERAEAVSAVSGVFLNLARRSQLLVHRQLALLDLMERRIEDPAELEDLFRLDHLATRMRRHAEGLIILSGATPGRGWRKPVALMDVVRAAVAEVEDYARVEVRRLPPVHVAGSSVADLTHLIAELVENATAFSPPHTRVHIHGEALGSDFALQIHDEGLGMGEEVLAEANRRIGSARQADLYDADRLGLFVVSRLATRIGLEVHLTRSPFGGTTALVMVPEAVLVSPEQGRLESAPGQPAPAHAHAAVEGAAVAESVVAGVLAAEQGASHQSAVPRQAGAGRGGTDHARPGPAETVPWPQRPMPRRHAGAPAGFAPAGLANGQSEQAAEAGRPPGAAVPDGAAGDPILIGVVNGATSGVVTGGTLNSGGTTGAAVNGSAVNGAAVNGTVVTGKTGFPPGSRFDDGADDGANDSFESGFGAGPGQLDGSRAGAAPASRPEHAQVPQPPLPPRESASGGRQLPRRVRQAHIAPQLRAEPGNDPLDSGSGGRARRESPEPTVSPEQARRTMAAFQAGWRQGRAEHPRSMEPAEPAPEWIAGGSRHPDLANTEGVDG